MLAMAPENRPAASAVIERLERIASAPQRQRQRLAVTATVSGLTLGLVVSLFALGQVQAERRFAEAARVEQAAVSDFLGDVLASPRQRGADIRVRDVLDQAVATVHRRFEAHPAAQIEVLNIIARSYLNLGLQPQARSALSEALALSIPIHGRDAEISLDLEAALGAIAKTLDPPDQAQAMLEDVLTRTEMSLGAEHRLSLYLLFQLGSLHHAHQRIDQASELFALILDRGPAQKSEARNWEYRAMVRLANIKLDEGHQDEAQTPLEEVVDLVGDALMDPDLVISLVGARMGLASAAVHRSDMDTAERMYIELLEQIEMSQGEDHANLRINLINLGGVLNWQHKYDEAIPYLERALALCRRHESPGTRIWQAAKTNLANALVHTGNLEQARELREAAFAASREVMGENHRSTLIAQTNLAEQYVLDGDGEAAEKMALDASARATRVFNPDHVYVLQADTIVARARFVQGRHEQAIENLLQVCAAMLEDLGEENVYTVNCRQTLTEFGTETQ